MGARIKLLLLAAGMLASVPASAAADTDLGESGGFFYVMNSDSSTGAYPVSVSCPARTHVAGGGHGGTYVTGSQPLDGPDGNTTPDDGWKIGAYQSSPFPSDVYAICTTRASTYVKGRQRDFVPSRTITAKAKCPSGTRVISGGGVIRGAATDAVRLHSSVPYDGPDNDFARDDGWLVRVPAFAQPGRLRANAVCQDTRPVYSDRSGELPPNGISSPTMFCPTTHHVVGVGIDSFGPASQGYILDLFPLDDAGSGMADADVVPDDFGQASASNGSGSVEAYTAVATCLQ